jgi:hypothetical protein
VRTAASGVICIKGKANEGEHKRHKQAAKRKTDGSPECSVRLFRWCGAESVGDVRAERTSGARGGLPCLFARQETPLTDNNQEHGEGEREKRERRGRRERDGCVCVFVLEVESVSVCVSETAPNRTKQHTTQTKRDV